jgi:hypothetical protein
MAAFETRAETAEEEARRARSRNPETRRDDKLKPFHNYRPPYRILLLELLVIISLITLTLFNPNTFSGGLAISKNAAGTDTVGLLSSSFPFYQPVDELMGRKLYWDNLYFLAWSTSSFW